MATYDDPAALLPAPPCPGCASDRVLLLQRRMQYVCGDCERVFLPGSEGGEGMEDLALYQRPKLHIFLSYGHDAYAELAVRLKHYLESRGHEVWFDQDQLSAGKDWEQGIVDGLEWATKDDTTGRFLLLLTPHAVRRPNGYCLNEVAKAVTSQVSITCAMVMDCQPPQSIETLACYDMRDCVPSGEPGDGDDAEWAARVDASLGSAAFLRKSAHLASLLELDMQPEARSAAHLSLGAGGGDALQSPTGRSGAGKARLLVRYSDSESELAARLHAGLVEAEYEVFPLLEPGGDRAAHFSEGVRWVGESGKLLLLMTPETVGRPNGVCLNEVTAASSLDFVPLMVRWCEAPLSICRIQWLDMRSSYSAEGELLEDQVAAGLQALKNALVRGLDHEGNQSRLWNLLMPLEFHSDISKHTIHFSGRQWLLDRIGTWLETGEGSALFVEGPIGSGKTAVAARLCERRSDVCAFHLASYVDETKRDPRRCLLSLAYQLSTQIPGFATRLLASKVEEIVQVSTLQVLFEKLILQPLATTQDHPDRAVIIVDALDSMTHDGANELARLLAIKLVEVPSWCKFVLFSRNDPEVATCFQDLAPVSLAAHVEETNEDLKQYLRTHLAFYYQRAAAEHGEEVKEAECAVPDDVMDFIVGRAEGLFLFAEQIVNAVTDGRLDLNDLSSFPSGLGGVLSHFFRKQFADLELYERHCRPLLEVMGAAYEPLSTRLLAAVLGLNSYEMLRATNAFGTLFSTVRVGGGDDDVLFKPFHISIMDWVTDSKLAGVYYVDAGNGHRLLAEWGREEYERARRDGADAFLRDEFRYVVTHALSHMGQARSTWASVLESDANFLLAQRVLAIRARGLSSFYHTNCARPDAEARLRGQPRGTFLIRYSSSQSSYCVSFVNDQGACNHYLLFETPPSSTHPHGGFSTQAQRNAATKVYEDLVEFVVDFQMKGVLQDAVPE